MDPQVIITCEHATHRIPKKYLPLFAQAGGILETHQGYDIGAAELSRHLSRQLPAPLFLGTYSRLLVDLNRRFSHRKAFSRFTRSLAAAEKERILEKYHAPYRSAVTRFVRREIENQCPVIHLSIHSFTPELNGVVRNADIGVLYDPKRPAEKIMARHLLDAFRANMPHLRHRCNYPYQGISDSLTAELRKKFKDAFYEGIEIEVNQKLAKGPPETWQSFNALFAETVRVALNSHRPGGTPFI
jgi:predicted N-formylglutamate amidohydrolase